jgi:hypothetical protein
VKSVELKKIAIAYSIYLPEPWQQVGNEFFRREGDWVQIVGFNASRFLDQYVPRSCMEFLKIPGVPAGAFLVQELQNPNATQRWVKITDAPANIFEQMALQFKPPLRNRLNRSEIKRLLDEMVNYWPHAYALCVMACEEGNSGEAQHYFNEFVLATSNKPYPWAEARKQELTECLEHLTSPEALTIRLENLRDEKLRALKLKS